MRLRVRPLKRKDAGSGLAAIDRESMGELGVESGEFVAIEGREGRVIARVWPGRSEDAVVIAATNRPDLIDDALLRPGRLDHHVEVAEPDEDARREIFEVHTRDRPLAEDVDLADFAARAEGYTGADVEAVCREAATAAVREHVHAELEGEQGDVEALESTAEHFETAFEEVTPGDDVGSREGSDSFPETIVDEE